MDSRMSLQLISKYRTELMGVAIIGVLIGHIIDFNNLNFPIINSIAHGIHTQGFLFLSGFGLFYSLSKNPNVGDFYVRRFWRFYLPFLLIYLPFLLRTLVTGNFNLLDFLSRISTFVFWFRGNVDGMWYIDLSLVLYLLTPLLYHWFNSNRNSTHWKILFVIVCSIAVNYIIQLMSPSYWDMVSIALKHTHMFFWGMLMAFVVRNNGAEKPGNNQITSLIGISIFFLYVLSRIFSVEIPYLVPLLRLLFYIILFCFLFNIAERFKLTWINSVFRWFGKYTLELYLLHILFHGLFQSPLFHLSGSLIIIVSVLVSIMVCVPVHIVINKLSNLLQHK